MEYPMKNIVGEDIGSIGLDDRAFSVPMNTAVVHQVMVAQLANARKGTASTKSRNQVSGGGRKPHPQKGTGRARQGTIRAPQWRGGGVVFGPHPRSYKQRTPKKMRRLAIRCLLSEKVSTHRLTVVDQLSMEQPSTKEIKGVLERLGAGSSVLIALEQADQVVHRSARNLAKVRVTPTDLLNVLDLLNYDHLIMTQEAVHKAEALWAQERPRRKVAA